MLDKHVYESCETDQPNYACTFNIGRVFIVAYKLNHETKITFTPSINMK